MVPQIRQGDVLLTALPAPPSPTPTRALDALGLPLAGLHVEGERTGHVHQLPARVYDAPAGRRLLFLERPETLTHQEHAHVEVSAGWWEVRIQREFVPAERPRRRFD